MTARQCICRYGAAPVCCADPRLVVPVSDRGGRSCARAPPTRKWSCSRCRDGCLRFGMEFWDIRDAGSGDLVMDRHRVERSAARDQRVAKTETMILALPPCRQPRHADGISQERPDLCQIVCGPQPCQCRREEVRPRAACHSGKLLRWGRPPARRAKHGPLAMNVQVGPATFAAARALTSTADWPERGALTASRRCRCRSVPTGWSAPHQRRVGQGPVRCRRPAKIRDRSVPNTAGSRSPRRGISARHPRHR